MPLIPARRHARLLVLLPLAGSLGACSSFYEKHPTAAAAALASMRQQLDAGSYRVQTEAQLEDVELSPSLQKTVEGLMDDKGDDDALGTGEVGSALGAARDALRAITGQPTAEGVEEADKPATPSAADDSMLAGIAADNRNLKPMTIASHLGSGYLHMLRNMKLQGDTVVDGSKGLIQHVSGMDYRTRTTHQSYHMPFMVDLRKRQLYWDAEAVSMLMNPVTRDKPVRIDLEPLNKHVDAMKLYGTLRQHRTYVLEHANADAIRFELLEDGPQVPGAYRKIRYQLPLRAALQQNRDFLRDHKDGIVQSVRDEGSREKVGELLDVLVGMGGDLLKPVDVAKQPLAAEPTDASSGQTADASLENLADVIAGDIASIEVPPEEESASDQAMRKMAARTLDDSTITQWLWLDRSGRLLREDKRHDLHLGGEQDYVKLKMIGRKIYSDAPSEPVAKIVPEQAVSLREAVKGSLVGYVLASVHDSTRKKEADEVSWSAADDAATAAAEAAVAEAIAEAEAAAAAAGSAVEPAGDTVSTIDAARAAYAAARAEQAAAEVAPPQ